MIQTLAFIAYPVRDIAASRRFYEEVLGLKLTHEALGNWFEYDLGDTTFAIPPQTRNIRCRSGERWLRSR